jgi:hypothetical protein
VAEFLVELYVSRGDAETVEGTAECARIAAEELSREGAPVRYVRAIFVPEDETCFYLYEADSAESVREAAQRAAIPFERIAEAVTDTKETK